MSKQREALEVALEALSAVELTPEVELTVNAIHAIREALDELENAENRLQCLDVNDPEYGAFDPQTMAEMFADNLHDDESGNFKVMVSVPLPDRIMRVELSKGEEREMSWEWVE